MSTKNRIFGAVTVCVTVIVLSVLGLASDVVSRLLSSVDGLLLLMICVMMVGIFTLMLFMLAKESGWLPAGRHPVSASASAARPADQAVQPNQATHQVAQAPARPVPEAAAPKSAVKAGEGK